MDKRDKLYELHSIFVRARGTLVGKKKLLGELECSEKTLQRRMKALRDIYGGPLEYNKEKHGWYYRKGESFELPVCLRPILNFYCCSEMK